MHKLEKLSNGFRGQILTSTADSPPPHKPHLPPPFSSYPPLRNPPNPICSCTQNCIRRKPRSIRPWFAEEAPCICTGRRGWSEEDEEERGWVGGLGGSDSGGHCPSCWLCQNDSSLRKVNLMLSLIFFFFDYVFWLSLVKRVWIDTLNLLCTWF